MSRQGVNHIMPRRILVADDDVHGYQLGAGAEHRLRLRPRRLRARRRRDHYEHDRGRDDRTQSPQSTQRNGPALRSLRAKRMRHGQNLSRVRIMNLRIERAAVT